MTVIGNTISKFFGGRLGAKILFWFLFLNAIAGISMIYFIHDFMGRKIISEQIADMAMKRDLASRQIKFGIHEHTATAVTISKAPLVRIFLQQADPEAGLLLSAYVSAIKDIHSSGAEHNIISIDITDKSGSVVLSTSEAHLNMNIGNTAFAQAALSGKSGFSGPFLSGGRHPGGGLYAYAPVFDKETVIGSVIVEEDIKYYAELMATDEFRPGMTEETYIVGNVKPLIPGGPDGRRMEFLSRPRFYSDLSNASSPPITAASEGRAGHMAAVNYNGDEVVSAYAPVEGTDWAVISEMHKSEALKSLNDLRLRLVLMGIAVVSVIGIISVSIARSITTPILNLHRAAKETGEGNLDAKIIVPTGDEIEGLADEFNLMRRKLKDSYAGLEEKVRERTEELEAANKLLEFEVSDRKASEEKLASAMGELDAILESAQTGIVYLRDRHIVRINRKLEEMLGIRREAVAGMTTEMFYTDRAAYENLGAEAYPALSGGRIYSAEVRLKRRDGSLFPANISGKAVNPADLNAGTIWIIEDITERKQAEGNILASLREKETLLKEIHHRVKNNLQVISSLLSLQSRSMADERLRDAFEDGRNRIRSMALIHEKLYESKDLARIDFASYASDLGAKIARSYTAEGKNISVKTDISVRELDMDDALPCGLIINELVANSLKYAFPAKSEGEIIISLRPVGGGQCELSVRDNGAGIPGGIRPEDPATLGLRLVRALVDQLEGVMEYSGMCGACFTIRFKPSDSRRSSDNA